MSREKSLDLLYRGWIALHQDVAVRAQAGSVQRVIAAARADFENLAPANSVRGNAQLAIECLSTLKMAPEIANVLPNG